MPGTLGKLESFPLTYENDQDAFKALTRLKKRMEKAPFDVGAEAKPTYIEVVRPGRKPKDPSKIPKKRVWRIEYEVSENPDKKRMIIRQAEIKVFITNIPKREDDPERGRSTSEVLDIYHGEWRVGAPEMVRIALLEEVADWNQRPRARPDNLVGKLMGENSISEKSRRLILVEGRTDARAESDMVKAILFESQAPGPNQWGCVPLEG